MTVDIQGLHVSAPPVPSSAQAMASVLQQSASVTLAGQVRVVTSPRARDSALDMEHVCLVHASVTWVGTRPTAVNPRASRSGTTAMLMETVLLAIAAVTLAGKALHAM